jgi:folylpolyglutamate synthase/dihydropteroate synthase
LLAEMTGHHAQRILIVRDPAEALETAIKLAGKQNTVFATGSLYLVGDLQTYWGKRLSGQSRDADGGLSSKTV